MGFSLDLNSIKLIVWDLDECLWQGTLSDGDVTVPEEHQGLVEKLADCGIIQSICSKNDFERAKARLIETGIWDIFVFPSISWNAKGPRLKSMLEEIALRPDNTLFIDDNPSNRGEAEYYVPGIHTTGPEMIPGLIRQFAERENSDPEHKRLQEYKTLEKRRQAAKDFTDSEKFLYDSDIRVLISRDCKQQEKRIYELLMRTNQLNFTKKRISIEELATLLDNPEYDCGYISSKDRFGDYGIVGFYALKDNHLEHFLFSCRIMGQKIEQWVYAWLGFPEITVTGEVAAHLNSDECPGWINRSAPHGSIKPTMKETVGHCRVLLKGPCDLSHSQVYLKNDGLFDSELGYTTDSGKLITAHNHSVHIEGLHTYSEQDRKEIANDCIFVDPPMLSGKFFTGDYDLIVLSTSFEAYYRIYRKKGTDLKVAFPGVNLTDPKYWPGLVKRAYYDAGNAFTTDYLQDFSSKYEHLGFTTPDMYLSFLRRCLQWLPEHTKLCLILGATDKADGPEIMKIRHLKLNAAIKDFAKDNPRISYIEVDDFIKDASDFTEGINHFSARVYYEISQAIVRTIKETTGIEVHSHPRGTVHFDSFLLKIRDKLSTTISPDSTMYKPLKAVYNRLYKDRH